MHRAVLALPSLFLLLGCSGPRFAYNEVDPKGLEGAKTLALAPPSERVVVLEGMHPVPPGFLQGMVLESMQAKGYVPAPPEEANLLLTVYLFAEGTGGTGASQGGPGGGHGGHGGGRGGGPMKGGPAMRGGEGPGRPEGDLSLVVHLVSSRTGKLVWGGTLEYPATRRQKGGPGVSELIRQFLQPLPTAK